MVLLIAGGAAVTWPGATERFGFPFPPPPHKTHRPGQWQGRWVHEAQPGGPRTGAAFCHRDFKLPHLQDPPFSGSSPGLEIVNMCLSSFFLAIRQRREDTPSKKIQWYRWEQKKTTRLWVGGPCVHVGRPWDPDTRKGTPPTITALQSQRHLIHFWSLEGLGTHKQKPQLQGRVTLNGFHSAT